MTNNLKVKSRFTTAPRYDVGIAGRSTYPRKWRRRHFLGWRIQRRTKKGTAKQYVYTYPSRNAVKAVTHKVKTICRRVGTNLSLDDLLRQLNPALQGWCAHFRPGVSSRTFGYLRHYAWRRVWIWLRHKHRRSTWKQLLRRYCPDGEKWWPATQERTLFNPAAVSTTRYRYRGTKIPSPWPTTG